MFTKEGMERLFGRACSGDDGQEKKSSSSHNRFVILENGRLVPIEPGGMVEIALNELGARIIEVEIRGPEKVKP
jgi:hypothetical protein